MYGETVGDRRESAAGAATAAAGAAAGAAAAGIEEITRDPGVARVCIPVVK